MRSAGFGAMGTPGRIDAPWQHRKDGDKLIPIEPGPFSDNPPFITPAGRVHCSMADWAKYIQCILAAARGEEGLLPASASVQQLKEPPFGGNYALGWGLHERPWAGGKALSHAGSNGGNLLRRLGRATEELRRPGGHQPRRRRRPGRSGQGLRHDDQEVPDGRIATPNAAEARRGGCVLSVL